MSLTDSVLLVAILIVSVVIHENAHGVVALALGDKTAKAAGRLTLNPIPHIDPVGSIILPALMAVTTGGAFGYAKPVPVNPRNLRGTDRTGFAIVALAGPVSNVILAFICVVLLRVLYDLPSEVMRIYFATRGQGFTGIPLGPRLLLAAFMVNLFLAAFNLLPIPPLDGSRLLRPFLSTKGREVLDRIEPFGFVILLVAILWLEEPLFRIVDVISRTLLRLLPL
jgi:Zn-dependent protease